MKREHDLREETREENELKISCLHRESSFWKGVPKGHEKKATGIWQEKEK